MMKRILTLAIAAILVIAFAIPAFAAPKVEIVGGMAEFAATWEDATGFVPDVSWSDVGLWLEFTADNFAFYIETYVDYGTDYYNFSLALPYMELTGDNVYNPSFTAVDPYIQLASDAKFEELAGFNWYATEYYLSEEFWAGLGTTIGPVSLNLDYSNDNALTDMEHYLGLGVAYDGVVGVAANVGKKVTSAFDDIGADLSVAFPIVDGLTGEFYAYYAMENAYDSIYAWSDTDMFYTSLDLRYKNEASNAQFLVDYANTSKFDGDSAFGVIAEYVSNGAVSTSTNARCDNYADTRWNTRYNWIRKNSGNEFAARVAFNYTLAATNAWGITGWAMFAPDFAPVVASLKATYDGSDFGIYNWIGVRITEDIHFALYDRYVVDTFELDTQIAYVRDSVTFTFTAANILDWDTTGYVEAYVGIAF